MRAHERNALAAVEAEVRKWGCAIQVAGFGSRSHLLVRILRGAQVLGTLTISSSPKNRDDCVNDTRRQARRIVKGVYS